MNRSLFFALTSLASLGLVAESAHAQHEIRAFVSERGVEFIEEQAASFVPSGFSPPSASKSLGCADFELNDPEITLSLDYLDIDVPEEGRIRVELEFALGAAAELRGDDVLACIGSVSCDASAQIHKGTVVIDFDLEIVDGLPAVNTREVFIEIGADDFEFSMTGCGLVGAALTKAVSFGEGALLNIAEWVIIRAAEASLEPELEKILVGLSMDSDTFRGSLTDLALTNGGLSVVIDAGLPVDTAPAECVRAYDLGGPKTEGGAAPDLTEGTSQLNLAVNLGLINEVFYKYWRNGNLCFTDESLAEGGVELHLSQVGSLLPGFPPGTEFGLELVLTDYPRVKGQGSADGTSYTAYITGLEVSLHGDRPDGTRNTLYAELGVELSASLITDPVSNSIYTRIEDAEITHMLIEDERSATGEGFDVARIKQLIGEAILPKLLRDLEPIPISASVFAVSDFAIIFRNSRVGKAYLEAGLDLFRVPEDDTASPETQIEAPREVGNPHNSVLRFSGTDSQIPSELMQFQVHVDGVERETTFVRDIKVGEVGQTRDYEVKVAAVDLSGNVDPTPATALVRVDGTLPFVMVNGARIRKADDGPAEISWRMSDDLTDAPTLGVRLEVYDLVRPDDVLSAELIEVQELPPGTTSSIVELARVGGVYRVEVHVTDGAGNDSQSSLLLSIAATGGCSVGGQGNQGLLLLLLSLGFLWLRRRER